MAGYNPNCDNFFKCLVCRANGTVDEPWFDAKSGKSGYKKVTCRTCNGAGGKAGAGKHDHY